MSKEMCIKTGATLKTRNLIEQAEYMFHLAKEDAAELATVGFTNDFMGEYKKTLGELVTMKSRQETGKNDIGVTTERVNEKVDEAKEWLRRSKLKAKRVFRYNKVVLDDFYYSRALGRSIPNTIDAMIGHLELHRQYEAEFAIAKGDADFIKEGETLLAELREMDSLQERTKTKLPEMTEDMHYIQGKLFNMMKDVRDMGLEVYIKNSTKKSAYGMDILKRGGAKKKEDGSGEAVV